MNNSEKLIETFYSSFQLKNWKGMQSCYSENVKFGDPVFQSLNGKEAFAMWHMLVTTGKDLSVTVKDINASETEGSCNWDAHYSFSRTGRKVHNIIHAQFKFKDGKITDHKDSFDLWRWSRMALGTSGILLGWSPIVQGKIRATAASSLRKFMDEHPEYQ